jgi:hypothetical protein
MLETPSERPVTFTLQNPDERVHVEEENDTLPALP